MLATGRDIQGQAYNFYVCQCPNLLQGAVQHSISEILSPLTDEKRGKKKLSDETRAIDGDDGPDGRYHTAV